MTMSIPHIASIFFDRPHLLLPSAATQVAAVLRSRMTGSGALAGGVQDMFAGPVASRFTEATQIDESGRTLPYRITPDGVAIISAVGKFVNRGSWIGAYSGLVSYEGFKYQVARAAYANPVKAIILDIESPGGEAIGAFEAAEVVRDARSRKPVVAVVNGMAASAAYAIASAATKVVTIPSGVSGSIGVIYVHFDFSKALENEGVKPTMIFAGDHKVDGNPFEPLPANVRKSIEREVGAIYNYFIETVAKNRGSRLTEGAARATQAAVFVGQAAVDAGLADEVGTFESVLAELSRASGATPRPVGRSVSVNSPHPALKASYAANEAPPKSAREIGREIAMRAKGFGPERHSEAHQRGREIALRALGKLPRKTEDSK